MSLSSTVELRAVAPLQRATATRDGGGSLFHSASAMLLLGIVLGICFGWQTILAIWQTGTFRDTDDAMHMVQVRDWMSGQGWFDMTARRMDLPLGVAMHWTRVTDIPIALLVRFFGLFLAPDMAERAMRIAYGLLLQAVFIAAVVSLTKKLVGARGIGVAVILAATSAALFGQLEPGRLSHQNVQVVLMMLMLRALLDICEPRCVRSSIALGLLCAFSLSISLEDLPFVAAAMAVAGCTWIARGPAMAVALAGIGGSIAVASLAAFALTIPPSLYGLKACDAFSGAHLIAALVGGLGFCLLAAATRRLTGVWQRALAMAVIGATVIGAVALTFPACLGDPFGAVDPLVRQVWLNHVSESRPLGALLWHAPLEHVALAAPLFLGLIFLGMAVLRESGDSRVRWIAVAAFALIGVGGAFWQVRMASYAGCTAFFGGVWLSLRCSRSARWSPGLRPLIAGIIAVPFSAAAWAMAVPSAPVSKGKFGKPEGCFAPAAFHALKILPDGVMFAGIDAGPFVLVHTGHATVTGPYHRDTHGLRLTIDAMLGNEATAHARVLASGATYVAICPASNELASYIEAAPHGFAARLRDGNAPAWLRPVNVAGTVYRVYQVMR